MHPDLKDARMTEETVSAGIEITVRAAVRLTIRIAASAAIVRAADVLRAGSVLRAIAITVREDPATPVPVPTRKGATNNAAA